MVSNRSLSESKSPQVFRTLLSVLTDLNNAVVWMVSTRLLISKSSTPFTNPFMTVPRASIIINITVTLMFHSFFNSLARSKLSLLSLLLLIECVCVCVWREREGGRGGKRETLLSITMYDKLIGFNGMSTSMRLFFYQEVRELR